MDVPFSLYSPYSPFFTSGLLSARAPDVPTSPRRGSLPAHAHRDAASEDVPAFYFTLQDHRDEVEFRSFLSLDLAESQSMRSASLKRKASASTTARAARATRTLAKPSEKLFRFPRISEVPVPTPVSAPGQLRMRFSRDSLRTIPSPKPAPSITLPELPKVAQEPPRLPSIQLTPALDLSFPLKPKSVHNPTPPRDVARLRLNLNLNMNRSHRASVATKASSSTVSTRARKYNRSEALARLEGRSQPATAPLPPPSRFHSRPLPTIPTAPASSASSSSSVPKRNFMSMSDDEDTSDDDDSDADGDNIEDDLSDLDSLDFPDVALLDPRMEQEDMVLPPLSSPTFAFLEAPRSAPLPPRSPHSPFLAAPRRTATSRLSTAADVSGAAKDWFPLKSFIDLHADSSGAAATASSPTTTTRTSTSGSSLERGADALRAEGRRRVYGAQPQKEPSSKDSRSSGSGGGGWIWRSFIEVANVS